MNTRNFMTVLFLIFLSVHSFAAEYTVNPRNMTFPPLAFNIPKSERVLLKNGIPVYLLQDRELPIVTLTALIRTGSVYDPAGKSGLASLTGAQMREGGVRLLGPSELDSELEFMASSVESSFSKDIGTVSMSSLSKNLERSLLLFSEVLLHPRFDSERFEVAKQHAFEIIRRQNDDPKELADRELTKVIYAGHPLGVFPDINSVNTIKKSDLVKFHQQSVRPDSIILAVAGDFDRNSMIASLNNLIGTMQNKGKPALPDIPQVQLKFSPAVLYADKKVNQSVIRMGHLGITKDDPDLYALRVLDFILGGSFTSRLMMEIRTNQGLAYNVGSHFDIGRHFTGNFMAETETRADATAKTINLMISIIKTISEEPVKDQELKLAKDSIINSFIFGFTTPSSIAVQQARLEFYGYQPDFLDNYRTRIAAVTKEQILKAAAKHLHPDALKLLVVGDQKMFDKPLDSFGKVTTIELKQP